MPQSFKKGDLVWRIRNDARKIKVKFSSNWEGPLFVADTVVDRAYYLEFLSGKSVPRRGMSCI